MNLKPTDAEIQAISEAFVRKMKEVNAVSDALPRGVRPKSIQRAAIRVMLLAFLADSLDWEMEEKLGLEPNAVDFKLLREEVDRLTESLLNRALRIEKPWVTSQLKDWTWER